MTTTPTTETSSTGARPLLRSTAIALVAALTANLAVFLVASAGNVEVVHPTPPGSDTLGPVMAVHVAASTAVGTVLALVAAGLALRFAPRPRATYLVLAGLGAVLSAGGPFSIAGAPAGSTAVLLSMHVLTPAILLPLLARALPRGRGGS